MTLFDPVVPFPQPEPHTADPVGQGNQEPPVRPSQIDPALIPCQLIVSSSQSVPQDVVLSWEGVQTGQQLGSHEYSVRSADFSRALLRGSLQHGFLAQLLGLQMEKPGEGE